MLATARERARKLEEVARQRGYQAGYEAGLEGGRREGAQQVASRLDALARRLQDVVDEAVRRRDQALAQCEQDVVKLALAVAERVVRRSAQESGAEITRAVLRSILEEVPQAGSGRVVVRVHPGEHAILEEAKSTLVAGIPGPLDLHLIADPQVEPGGCVVETEMGNIDAGLETRLAGVASAVWDAVHHGG